MEEAPNDGSRIKVSVFDDSIENYFRAMDTISKLCEEPNNDDLDENDIQRFSSSIIFLREWRHFNYEPRTIRFANELEDSQHKDVFGGIELPQFSSSTVSKDVAYESNASTEFSKDFVMYVGGSVWALDWCPQVHQNPNSLVKCEFIAIAAHPPESYYHKLGVPLVGRGIIQIWCVLNVRVNEEEVPLSKKKPKQKYQNREFLDESLPKRPRGRPRKVPIDELQPDQVKRPKRRPRKKSFDESPNSDLNVQPLSVHYPEDSLQLVSVDNVPGNTEDVPDKTHRKKQKGLKKAACASVATPETSRNSVKSKRKKQEKNNSDDEGSMQLVSVDNVPGNTQENVPDKNHREKQNNLKRAACTSVATSEISRQSVNLKSDAKIQNEESESSAINQQIHPNSGKDATAPNNVLGFNSFKDSMGSSIPAEVTLPRVVLCLAHNGKVVWDVKWKPYHINDYKCNQRMGYLAVLLGNGSLEVWEVPLPNMIKNIYSSSPKQGTDPRFVKLEPVFKCSKLKCGDIQSIPLTVEWSTSPPHDYLLAGCHDGMVALWKFSTSGSPIIKDTRPLLCFSADTVPIRSVAWAPSSDMESSNVILTAGHGGLKFWDIRDPFLPLWDIHQIPKFMYSVDWLPEPRCVMISFDDGTMRLLSLVHTACDVPVTGKPYGGTKQQGLHLYNCSSFAIWSVHVSRLTGMVAYCGADGTATCFQLTSKAVDKDFSRNRTPHFACGSFTEEDSAVIVNTPLPNIPLPLKKPNNECGDGQRSMRAFLTKSNPGKTAKEDRKAIVPVSTKQTLGLRVGNNPGVESELEETLASLKAKGKPKSKTDVDKKADADQALALRTEEPMTKEKAGSGKEAESGIETFPPKIVAVHRVRWNMNKGSERWLCYGGAAGIVRCQEINIPAMSTCKR